MKTNNFQWHRILPVALLAVLASGYIVYAEYQRRELAADVDVQRQALESMNTHLSIPNQSITTLANQDQALVQKLDSAKEQSLAVQEEIGNVSATVGTLDKLSKTDPQLLQKYSKVYFLNEHYVPSSLSVLEPQYVNDKTRTYQIHGQVLPHLVKMIDAAKIQGLNILVASSYRSFGTQAALKSSYNVTYGAGTANQFSADQGYSEHQLATTVDLTTANLGADFNPFDKTPEYTWMTEHAHEYGFVLSYPKSNAYYVYEPWHWRYVGVDLATKLHREGKYFYDYDQRIISSFLTVIFE